MAELVSLRCPCCTGKLAIKPDQKFVLCPYCGSNLFFDDGNVTITKKHIDEAAIKRIEAEERIELRTLELQERAELRAAQRRTLPVKLVIIWVLLCILFVSIAVFGHRVNETVGAVFGIISYVFVSLPIVGVITFVILKRNETRKKYVEDSRFFGLIKSSHTEEQTAGERVGIIWLVYVGLSMMVIMLMLE